MIELKKVFNIFVILIFVFTFACVSKRGSNKKQKQYGNFKIILSDQSDDFIALRKLDYAPSENAIYGLYYGMQRDMQYFYYKLPLVKPYSIEVLGSKGQGPENFKYGLSAIRFFNPFVIIGEGNIIKVFDSKGKFVNTYDNLSFYPDDFIFNDGELLVITQSMVKMVGDNYRIFLRYDVENKQIEDAIVFSEVKKAFEENGLNLEKISEKYTTLKGRVINPDIAVLTIPDTNKFNRNAFLIMSLKNHSLKMVKAKEYYNSSVFKGPFRSAVNDKVFFVVEQQTLIPLEKSVKMSEEKNSKILKSFVEKGGDVLKFCIHKFDIKGNEIATYPFNLNEENLRTIFFKEALEIKPETFVLCLRFNYKKGYKDLLGIWHCR